VLFIEGCEDHRVNVSSSHAATLPFKKQFRSKIAQKCADGAQHSRRHLGLYHSYCYDNLVNNDEAHAYAWNWFSIHAGQRLQLVNFWLVAVAFLAAAFVQSEISHERAIAASVALIGACASVAFQRLDARTRQLSQIAEDALLAFEDEWVAQGASNLIALVRRSSEVQASWTDSYRLIIQGLQLLAALVFVAALIYSLTG
jgi:hypothetical protein